MDVVKFIKEKNRMCESYAHCSECPAYKINCVVDVEEVEQMVGIVEKWSEDHPIKTNRTKLIEIFGDTMPNVFLLGESEAIELENWLDAEYKEREGDK